MCKLVWHTHTHRHTHGYSQKKSRFHNNDGSPSHCPLCIATPPSLTHNKCNHQSNNTDASDPLACKQLPVCQVKHHQAFEAGRWPSRTFVFSFSSFCCLSLQAAMKQAEGAEQKAAAESMRRYTCLRSANKGERRRQSKIQKFKNWDPSLCYAILYNNF